MRAVPGLRRALFPRKNHLEQLQAAKAKSGNGAGEIQTPHSRKLLAKLCSHSLKLVLKCLQPALARACVMHAQVFHVEHAEIMRFKELHHFTESWGISAGKNSASNPGVHRPWP